MHILLTDRLSCPRCGPDFGLILLAREMKDRRVIHGEFGCSNCRDMYPVEDGFGDLRAPPRRPLSQEPSVEGKGLGGDSSGEESDHALRLAALLGVTEGPATLLLVGPSAFHAGAVSSLISGVEVVAVHSDLRFTPQEEGVSRIVCQPGLPFFSGTFMGVALSGSPEERILLESLRVLSPSGRIAIMEPSPGTSILLQEGDFQILMDAEGVLVAKKSGGWAPQLVTLRGP
jgi:uncharacterized protein YbaR (Trm112 family)